MTTPDSGIVVRPAYWQRDGKDLLQIRFAVFVDEQGVPPELEQDDHDDTAYQVIATTIAGKSLGTARMLENGQIGRMAVLAHARRQGVGGALLQHLVESARDRGLTRVFLHAQLGAVAFYARYGFVAHGPVFDDAGIDHRAMSLDLCKRPSGKPPPQG